MFSFNSAIKLPRVASSTVKKTLANASSPSIPIHCVKITSGLTPRLTPSPTPASLLAHNHQSMTTTATSSFFPCFRQAQCSNPFSTAETNPRISSQIKNNLLQQKPTIDPACLKTKANIMLANQKNTFITSSLCNKKPCLSVLTKEIADVETKTDKLQKTFTASNKILNAIEDQYEREALKQEIKQIEESILELVSITKQALENASMLKTDTTTSLTKTKSATLVKSITQLSKQTFILNAKLTLVTENFFLAQLPNHNKLLTETKTQLAKLTKFREEYKDQLNIRQSNNLSKSIEILEKNSSLLKQKMTQNAKEKLKAEIARLQKELDTVITTLEVHYQLLADVDLNITNLEMIDLKTPELLSKIAESLDADIRAKKKELELC